MTCDRYACADGRRLVLEFRSRRTGDLLRSREPESIEDEVEAIDHPADGEIVSVAVARCEKCHPEKPEIRETDPAPNENQDEQIGPWWNKGDQ